MLWNLKKRIMEMYSTQVDFAEVVGVSESYISRVIRGRREPTDSEKIRWSKLLKCKPDEIFS